MRTKLTAVTAALAALAVAVPATAPAASAKPAGKPATTITTKGKRPKSAKVQAGATNGKAKTQKYCDRAAKTINSDIKKSLEAAKAGDTATAQQYSEMANMGIDIAMNNGCFIVY